MATEEMKNIGDEILKEIIREGLAHADSKDVCVWAANAAEVLEAIAMRHAPELYRRGMEMLHDGNMGDLE